jgi:hypothetical protein
MLAVGDSWQSSLQKSVRTTNRSFLQGEKPGPARNDTRKYPNYKIGFRYHSDNQLLHKGSNGSSVQLEAN